MAVPCVPSTAEERVLPVLDDASWRRPRGPVHGGTVVWLPVKFRTVGTKGEVIEIRGTRYATPTLTQIYGLRLVVAVSLQDMYIDNSMLARVPHLKELHSACFPKVLR
jgi:hypothetical protein